MNNDFEEAEELFQKNFFEEAAEKFISAVKDDLSVYDKYYCFFKAGICFSRVKKIKEAFSAYEKAKLYSSSPELLYNIGLCYIKMDNFKKAYLSLKLSQALYLKEGINDDDCDKLVNTFYNKVLKGEI